MQKKKVPASSKQSEKTQPLLSKKTRSTRAKETSEPYLFQPITNLSSYHNEFFPVRPLQGEGNFPKSDTIPDQSLTIRQILDRHTRGLRIPDSMVGRFDEGIDPLNLDGVDFNSLDLVDKMSIVREHRRKSTEMRQEFNRQQATLARDRFVKDVIRKHEDSKPAPVAPSIVNS